MRRSLLFLALGLLLLPSEASASGGGFVNFNELVEPLGWRWFWDDDADHPAASAPEEETLRGVEADHIVRLRYQVICNERTVNERSVCWEQAVDLGFRSGPWSCLDDEEGDRPLLHPGGPLWYADGLGQHGSLVSELLLSGSDLAGYFQEQPPRDLSLTIDSEQRAEYDFCLAPLRTAWRPNTRVLFFPHQVDEEGDTLWALKICNPATLCTRAGASVLAGAEPLRWSLALPYSAPVDVVDWDEDGRQDLLAGMVLSSPVLFLNRTEPGDAAPRFAPGLLLQLEVDEGVNLARAAAADWDGDGDMDLVAGSELGEVWLFENDGAERFELVGPLQYLGDEGELLLVGRDDGERNSVPDIVDWDQDGSPDLILGGRSGDLWLWLHSEERGSPVMNGPPQEVLAAGRSFHQIGDRMSIPESGDWNGDGLFDLLVSFDAATVFVALNVGQGARPSFGEGLQVDLGQEDRGRFVFPCLIDADGDARSEMVLGTTTGEVLLIPDEGLEGQPDFSGPPAQMLILPPEQTALYGDRVLWDESGMPPAAPRRHDLLVSREDGSVEVLLGVGREDQPSFGARIPVLDAQGDAVAPELADLDGDGVKDLILGHSDGSLTLRAGTAGPGWPRFADPVSLRADGAPIQVAGQASARVFDWDQDGRPDLLVGSADGGVLLFLAGDGGLTAAGQLLPAGEGSSIAVCDWDDDGLTDLLAVGSQGELLFYRNHGEPGSPELAPQAETLQAGGEPLVAGRSASLVATDYNPLDCARDIVLVGVSGQVRIYRGHVPTPPAPDDLLPRGDADAVSGEPIPIRPELRWEAAQPPLPVDHRYEVELAERSDFGALLFDSLLLTDGGELRESPSLSLQPPQELSPGRRYFWRVRALDAGMRPGYWASPPAGFAVPIERHNPVDREQVDDGSRGRWIQGSGWASLKGLDGQDEELARLPIAERIGRLQEEHAAGGFGLAWVFVFDDPALLRGRYDLMLVAGTEGDGEELRPEVATQGGAWAPLDPGLQGPMNEHRWPLPIAAVEGGQLLLRLADSGPDPEATVALLDYAAAVLVEAPPLARVGAEQSVGEEEQVRLDGSDSEPGEEWQELSYAWEQTEGPDVLLANADSPEPGFLSPRVFEDTLLAFRLTVSSGELWGRAEARVTVRNTINEPPVADAGEDRDVPEASMAQLDGSGSSDPNGDELVFSWERIDGLEVELDDPASRSPSFETPALLAQGAVSFRLTVSDGQAESDDEVHLVVLNSVNEPPVAVAGEDQVVRPGQPVALDGSGSSDPNDDQLGFQWEQIEGSEPPDLPQNLHRAVVAFIAPEIPEGQEEEEVLVFRLTVSDGQDQAADEVSVMVRVPGGEGEGEGDAGLPDIGPEEDTGPPDTGPPDAGEGEGEPDLGVADAGPEDAGRRDIGEGQGSPDSGIPQGRDPDAADAQAEGGVPISPPKAAEGCGGCGCRISAGKLPGQGAGLLLLLLGMAMLRSRGKS